MRTLTVAIVIVLVGTVFGACGSSYECGNGICIPRYYRCDGDNDCNDQSDEIGCPPCSCDEYTCGNGTCIPASYACDAYVDCSNGEDDLGCGNCGLNQFQCADGSCIQADYICDGTYNCQDRTDERGCNNLALAKRSMNHDVDKVKGSVENVIRRVQAAVTNVKEKGVFVMAKDNGKLVRSTSEDRTAKSLKDALKENRKE